MELNISRSKSAEPSKMTKAPRVILEAPSNSSSKNDFGPSTAETVVDSGKQSQQGSKPSQERRGQKRARVKIAARIGPAYLTPGQCTEIIVTVNASRQSLYFVTDNESYHLGMRLRVNFPYDPAHQELAGAQEFGEVMRTERLPDHRIGVAVQLGKPGQVRRSPSVDRATSPAARKAGGERRAADRHPFSAEAVIIDLYDSMRVQARCSDLSLQGCYVDTLNPFPAETLVRVELRATDKAFEAIAVVHSSHVGMGMGIQFQDLSPEQTAVLQHWLNSEPCGRAWAANPVGTPRQPESTDRNVAINLIRDMIAKGILTKADISDILFNNGNI